MTRHWKKSATLSALVLTGALCFTAPAANAQPTRKPGDTAQGTTTSQAAKRSVSTKAARRWSCPKHRICFYQLKHGGGHRAATRHSYRKLGWWNNRTSSIWNRTTYYLCIYNGFNWRGHFRGHPHTKYYISPHSAGNLKRALDNRLSSHRWRKSPRRC